MGYLREKMAPYAPLLTKVPFYLTDSVIQDDNTNSLEYWFKVFKTDILQGQRNQKISRVVRALAENVAGNFKTDFCNPHIFSLGSSQTYFP